MTVNIIVFFFFFFSSRRRHTRCSRDWSSDVCSSDLPHARPCPEGWRSALRGGRAEYPPRGPSRDGSAIAPPSQGCPWDIGRSKGRSVYGPRRDRKSTRLNSSHGYISYAVFCLKKKKNE